MDRRTTRLRSLVGAVTLFIGAAALLCLLAMVPIAAAGSAGGERKATTSASVKQQVKKLKKQVNQLQQQLDQLALQPGPPGPQGEQGEPGPPGSLTGPAGGDLTGEFPNPAIANGAISGGTGGEVLDNTLTDADLAPAVQFNGAGAGGDLTGSYPSPDIGPNAVGASELADKSVDTFALQANSVDDSAMQDDSVGGAEVVNGSIENADLAPTAGGARAYARVEPSGAFSRSKNVAYVARPSGETGIYCIALGGGIDPSTAVLVVGPERSQNGTSEAGEVVSHVEWNSDGTSCGPGELEVQTFMYFGDPVDDDDAGGNTPGDDLTANDESFVLMVP